MGLSTVYVDTAGASAAAPVQDVNGETGNVVLDTDDVNEGTTNLYFTDPRVAASPSVAANTLKVSADGSIDTHSDVDTTTTPPGTDDVLSWNGSEWVPQDPDSIIDEVELVRNFYVSKNGNDGTGTGSLSKPFLTIGACITYINANLTLGPDNNAIINVAAGECTEGTLALPRFCSLEGKGYRTKITASSGSIDLITSQGANTIKGLILRGVTNASNYLINVSATQDTRTIIEEISLSDYEGVGTISNGIKLSSTSGTLTVRARALDFDDITGTCILLDNNTELVVKENRTFDGCSGATYLDAQGNCTYSVTDVEVCNLNLALNHNTTGDGRFVDSNIRKAATNIIKTTSSILTVSNVNLSSNRVLLTEEDKVNGNYRDDVSGDEKLRVIDELSVGLPGAGKESVFGEGDSYTNGILVYTFDGSIYTDVTDDAIDLEANTFSFPNTNDDSAIYVSTERLGSGSPLMFPGVKVDVQTAAVLGAGEIVAEYWNGSSWVEFNHVSTQSFGKFLPFAKQVFERTGEEHIRFNYEIEDDWAINDPVSFGTDLHWMRFRLEGNITTSPVFQSLKVHSNRSEINADGYKEFFGSARPVSTLPFDIGNFEASANSPSNADVYFSDVLGVGRQENLFADSTTDRVGLAKPFPSDIDTSCPIILKLYWTNQDFSDPDPFDITVYWANSVIGDTVGDSQGDVPATVPTQQSIQQDYTLTATNEIAFQEFTLDVSGVIARRDSDPGDILWLSVERSPDSNGSDIILVQLQIEYTKLSAGGHI